MRISGFNNAAASILPGALLVDGVCRIENVPDLVEDGPYDELIAKNGLFAEPVERQRLDLDTRRE